MIIIIPVRVDTSDVHLLFLDYNWDYNPISNIFNVVTFCTNGTEKTLKTCKDGKAKLTLWAE